MKPSRLAFTLLLALSIAGMARVAMAADQIHFTLISPTAVTFDWSGSGVHTIYFGTASGNYTRSVVASAASPAPWSDAGPYYEATLTGLTPDTLYHYKIDSGAEHTFKTMPNPGTPKTFKVVVQSDGGDHLHYSTFVPSEELIAAQDPDLVLYVGDTSHNNRDSNSYLGRIAHFQDVQVWSQDAPYMMIYGNHDWDKPSYDDLDNYKGRFAFPNPQASPGSPTAGGEDWYWFDYGRVRFINYPEPWTSATWTDWQTQATALMDEAQADSKIDYIVTYGHRPAYSSGHHPGSSTLQGILDKLGANHSKYVLNFNGHSHVYERTFPQNGVVHVTDSSPAVLEAESSTCKYLGGCPAPSWSDYRAYHLGFVELEVSPDGIQGSFICGPHTTSEDVTCAEGSVLETWSIGNPIPSTLSVTLNSPAGGATLSGAVTLSATAMDNIGVTKVEFYRGTTLIGTGTNTGNTWQRSWSTTGVPNGSYSLTAKAYNAAGNSNISSAVIVTVSNAASDATLPIVALTSPAGGATLSGAVTLSATASDNTGVTKVDFYAGTTLIGSGTRSGDTWQRSWSTTSVSKGSYSLTAKAYDAAGNSATSSAVSVTVVNTARDTKPPAVTLTSPAGGATLSGARTLSATATDNTGVAKVEFYAGTTLIGTGTGSGSTWQRNWSTTSISNGSYSLTAKAYDAAGNSKTSSAVSVTVSNAATDTTAPIVNLTSPAGGATLSGTVTLSATATDPSGVAKVEFYSGSTFLGQGAFSGATWQLAWNTASAQNGSCTLTAEAYDSSGNFGASSPVSVVVLNGTSSGTTKTLTFAAVADSYVRSASPTGNFGTNTQVFVESQAGGIIYTAYVKFTAAGISGTVQSAKVRLYASGGTDDGPAIYSTSNSWTETGITAQNAPAATGPALGDKGAIANSTWVEYDVTTVVKSDGTYSFMLPPSSSDCLNIISREGLTPPELVVTVLQ